jgi:hypothetical protein
MRRMLAYSAVLHAVVASTCLTLGFLALGSPAAHAGAAGPGSGVTGNDTGGIIQWTPEVDRSYVAIAVEHCARYGRYAGISSVRHVYGDYIGFRCVYDRRFDPRKMELLPAY